MRQIVLSVLLFGVVYDIIKDKTEIISIASAVILNKFQHKTLVIFIKVKKITK